MKNYTLTFNTQQINALCGLIATPEYKARAELLDSIQKQVQGQSTVEEMGSDSVATDEEN